MGQDNREGVARLQGAKVTVLFTGGLHRILTIIDYRMLGEVSLNILSQSDSCEMMRHIDDPTVLKHIMSAELDYLLELHLSQEQ